jgi:hypothetical protein
VLSVVFFPGFAVALNKRGRPTTGRDVRSSPEPASGLAADASPPSA